MFASILAVLLLVSYGAGTHPAYLALFIVVRAGTLTLVIYRFGQLALLLLGIVQQIFVDTAFTLDLSMWYAAPTVVICLLLVALTAYGCVVSTGGLSAWAPLRPAGAQ